MLKFGRRKHLMQEPIKEWSIEPPLNESKYVR
jgi:hypothetical protein